jgi:hypothetical protein
MARRWNALPQLGPGFFLTDGRLPRLTVMGGCGTDHRHVERIAEACVPLFRAAT